MGSGQKPLRNYFVAGVLVLAPIGLTVWLIRFLLTVTDALLRIKNGRYLFVIPEDYHPSVLLGFDVPFLGLVLAIALVLTVGIFARNFFGRRLIRLGEDILRRIPLIRTVYHSSKQLLETILDEKSRNFKEVVLLDYPRLGLKTLGFVSGSTVTIKAEPDQKLVSVFVPTTPNPTSGFFILVPVDDLVKLDLTTEEAFKLIISFGIVTPLKSWALLPFTDGP